MFAPVFISVIILSAIIYLAISRRSSFQVRIAALVALGAMIITVIICLFRIFMAPAAAKTPLYPDMPPPEPARPPNTMGLILTVIILLGVFMLILFLSLREQRRVAKEENDPLRKLGL